MLPNRTQLIVVHQTGSAVTSVASINVCHNGHRLLLHCRCSREMRKCRRGATYSARLLTFSKENVVQLLFGQRLGSGNSTRAPLPDAPCEEKLVFPWEDMAKRLLLFIYLLRTMMAATRGSHNGRHQQIVKKAGRYFSATTTSRND